MKEITFILIWIGVCLAIGGKVLPDYNDNVDYQDQYCSTGGLTC